MIYNVANFTRPAPGQPALLSFDDVTTMFHEFGHALHGLFASQTWPLVSGTNVARDFVEFPSQFNEHWALYPDVLKHYAVNQKGQVIPQALVDKIKASDTWGQGYELGELLAASQLDMRWHTLPPGAPKPDADAFEAKALHDTGTDFPNVPTRYRSSYFLHIWANGYASGYYAYQWTVMLDDDAYAWFIAHGGLTRANGQRFRDLILSRGHTLDYGPMSGPFMAGIPTSSRCWSTGDWHPKNEFPNLLPVGVHGTLGLPVRFSTFGPKSGAAAIGGWVVSGGRAWFSGESRRRFWPEPHCTQAYRRTPSRWRTTATSKPCPSSSWPMSRSPRFPRRRKRCPAHQPPPMSSPMKM